MRIPVGNFGNVVAAPAPIADTSPIARGTQQLGNAISNIGEQTQDFNLQQQHIRLEKQQELARAKDGNNYLDHQFQVKQLESDFTNKLASGELDATTAQSQFDEAVTKIKVPQVNAYGEVASENFKRGIDRTIKDAQFGIASKITAATERDIRSQGAQQLDSLGKLAGLPNANVDDINAKADSVLPLLRRGGLTEDQASKAIQDFKDANWFNHATNRAMLSKDNLSGLKQLQHDLTAEDGYYAQKMDTNKRNAVLNQVINSQITLENRAMAHTAKRDASAARTIGQIETQIASGVPATPEMWDDWQAKTRGTEFEEAFNEQRRNEVVVQDVLRKPVNEQLDYVQKLSAKLDTEGGSVQDLTNLRRLTGVVQQNVKLMQESPLQFNANRTGVDVQPLDLGGLMSGDANTFTAQINDRMSTIGAMRKQYGTQVGLKPLLPQEAAQLTSALKTASPKQQSQLFGDLYHAFGDANAYKAAMQQIAPDSPVKAMAGMLTASQAELTTATHWFKPNEIKFSGDVAATLLQGESMLNATKDDKSTDGKPNSKLYLPETNTLQADFQNKVGSAFTGRPEAAEVAMQAVKAYYVGRAAETGRLAANNKDIDGNIVQEAITATLGSVVDFNGSGEVFAPWGMNKSAFINAAQSALVTEGRRQGLGDNQLNAFGSAGLRQASGNTYYVVQGRNYVHGKDGKPIVITVKP